MTHDTVRMHRLRMLMDDTYDFEELDLSSYPDLPAFLDRRLRAVPKTTQQENYTMSLEERIAALTEAVTALTTVIKGASLGKTGTVDNAGGADDGAGKKSGKGAKGDSKGAAEEGKSKLAYPEVSALITKLAKEKGRDAAVEVLAKFGVKNGKDLKTTQYEEVVAKVNEALNAEEDLA